MKITIIGPSAGGKSVLARKLSKKFSVPRLELDRLWFKHGGHELNHGCTVEEKQQISDKIRADIEQFMSQNEHWVTEGTYTKLQPIIAGKADVVILIQRPILARIWSHVTRVLQGKNRHSEVTKWQDLGFVKTMLKRWRKGERKNLDDLTEQFRKKVVVLQSFAEIDDYAKTFDPSRF